MRQFSEAKIRLGIWTLIGVSLLSACSGPGLPLRKDPDKIRATLLAQTPVGTSSDSVVQSLQAQNYSLTRVKTGYVRRTGESSYEEIGVESIKADLGKYSVIPFVKTDVTGYWGFDLKGNLVNIWVTKGGDTR